MGLGFVKIGVDAVVCEEGVVGSVFGDAAVVEDHDDIGILDGGQAVRLSLIHISEPTRRS